MHLRRNPFKCLKSLITSEINSELQQDIGINPYKMSAKDIRRISANEHDVIRRCAWWKLRPYFLRVIFAKCGLMSNEILSYS
jgi:hypothetical protein